MEGGAQGLFRAEAFRGATVGFFNGPAEGSRNQFEAAANEEANEQGGGERKTKQNAKHEFDLALPELDARRTLPVKEIYELVESGPDVIHLLFCAEVELGVADGRSAVRKVEDAGGEIGFPAAVGVSNLGEQSKLLRIRSGPLAHAVVDTIQERIEVVLGFMKGLEEARVSGDLKATEAGLLIDDELADEGHACDSAVGALNLTHGLRGALDLDGKGDGKNGEGEDGDEKDLSHDGTKLTHVHRAGISLLMR